VVRDSHLGPIFINYIIGKFSLISRILLWNPVLQTIPLTGYQCKLDICIVIRTPISISLLKVFLQIFINLQQYE